MSLTYRPVKCSRSSTGEATSAITKDVYVVKDQTITFSQPSGLQLGDEAMNLGATASSGLTVSYSLNNDKAELAGNYLIAKHAGEVVVTASQSGNEEYNPADDVERTITIAKGDDEIEFEAPADVVWNEEDIDLEEFASSRSDRDIVWSGSDPTIATVSSSGIVNPLKPGTITITASLAGNEDWNAPEDVQQTLTVLKADQTITFDPLPEKSEGDQNFNLSFYASVSTGLPLTYDSNNTNVASISDGQIVIEGAGTAIITASQTGNDYYNSAEDVQQTITVTESIYIWEDGIWQYGETFFPSFQPTIDDDVEIRQNYAFSIQGPFSAKNLTITSSGSMSVNDGSALEVKEDLINNGSLTIQPGSSLITYDGNTVADNIVFKRNTRYMDGRYSFVGSPVEQNGEITTSDLGMHVYTYDEAVADVETSLSRWIATSGTDPLVPGRGYTQANQKLIEFVGKPNAGTITYSGSYENDGWHLVSNPYPAAIFIDAFLDANMNTTDAIYIWDDNGSNAGRGSSNDYIVANKTAATDMSGPDNEARWNEHIGSAQGFFVQLDGASGNITFNQDMRVSGNNADENFFRKAVNETPLLRMNLTHTDGLIRQTIIGWNEDVSNTEIAEGYDAKVFSTTADYQIYTSKANSPLAIQTVNSQVAEIPVGIRVAEAGTYAIEFKPEHLTSQSLYLLDNETGNRVSMNDGPYSFATSAGHFADRFVLTTASGILALDDQKTNIYAIDKVLHIEMAGFHLAEYLVYNLSGKRIMQVLISGTTKIDLNHVPNGVYLISDGMETKKIILK